jgi:hypothetical protein
MKKQSVRSTKNKLDIRLSILNIQLINFIIFGNGGTFPLNDLRRKNIS